MAVYRAKVFQIKVHQKHLEGLLNPLLAPLSECLIHSVWGGARELAFLVNSQPDADTAGLRATNLSMRKEGN